jgi:hypothetical protein
LTADIFSIEALELFLSKRFADDWLPAGILVIIYGLS